MTPLPRGSPLSSTLSMVHLRERISGKLVHWTHRESAATVGVCSKHQFYGGRSLVSERHRKRTRCRGCGTPGRWAVIGVELFYPDRNVTRVRASTTTLCVPCLQALEEQLGMREIPERHRITLR